MGSNRPPTGALAAWEGTEQGLFQHLGPMLNHPRFGAAVRLLARNMLDLAADDPALDQVFKDAGRYVVAAWSMYLAADDALTLPRLKLIGLQLGILSPGRVRALMQVLEHLGYLEVRVEARGRLPAVYAPTPAFEAAWRRHHRVALQAAAVIEPEAEAMIAALDDPKLYAAFCRRHADGLLRNSGGGALEAPFFQVLYQSYAGIQLVWAFLAAMEDEVFPPRTPLRFSAHDTARRFGVSPAHIRRVLAAAEKANLIRRDGSGGVVLSDDANGMLGFIYAGQLIMLLDAASWALRGAGED
jgi:hypothetical protein